MSDMQTVSCNLNQVSVVGVRVTDTADTSRYADVGVVLLNNRCGQKVRGLTSQQAFLTSSEASVRMVLRSWTELAFSNLPD